MFYLTKPDRREIEAFIASQDEAELSYSCEGATLKPEPPDDSVIDHNRIGIGKGNQDWQRAKDAIRNWKMFDFPWVELCWSDAPIEKDRTVAILVSHLGFYSLNAARIVYTIDEPNRFGFAYGTLADHGECGEERFTVERDDKTGEIRYDLYAFSKPNHILSWIGYPIARMFQKQFAADSKAAMINYLLGSETPDAS